MKKTIIAATVAVVSLTAATSAFAAETFFWDGHSTAGKCGAAQYKGSVKIDDPRVSGITQVGTAQNWMASCKYPTTTAQNCYWTTAALVGNGKVGSGLQYVIKGSTTAPLNTKTYWGVGTSWVDSPVVCSSLIQNLSHAPQVRIYNSDGTFVLGTPYS